MVGPISRALVVARPLLRWALAALAGIVAISACTYMKHVGRQEALSQRQLWSPSLANQRHLIDAETYYIYGKIVDPRGQRDGDAVAVAAYANAFGKTELVDIMHNASVGTHYGLNIPRAPGKTFRLLVLFDKNANGQFDTGEVIGERSIGPEERQGADHVLRNIDIELSDAIARIPAPVPVRQPPDLKRSLYFPGGSIRALDDPIFNLKVATLGMYEPAAFRDKVPTTFFALEEEAHYKIPVVFVHGLGGTPRQFQPLVERLDRRRFKPWFFYYPSGEGLEQLAELFYGIFLSGDAVVRDPMTPTVIVAHSMGGLIVREALNMLGKSARASDSIRFISIASPFGGHRSAAAGEKRGFIVLPAWRSLNPSSQFIARLYRRPLPPTVSYHLLYTFQEDRADDSGEKTDGVVPLSSQRRTEALAESSLKRGFEATHVGVLSEERALDFLVTDIQRARTKYPPAHMEWFLKGGFVVQGASRYGPIPKYLIETQGQYLQALARGQIAPIDAQQRHFVEAVNGRAAPEADLEKAWLEFVEQDPDPTPKG